MGGNTRAGTLYRDCRGLRNRSADIGTRYYYGSMVFPDYPETSGVTGDDAETVKAGTAPVQLFLLSERQPDGIRQAGNKRQTPGNNDRLNGQVYLIYQIFRKEAPGGSTSSGKKHFPVTPSGIFSNQFFGASIRELKLSRYIVSGWRVRTTRSLAGDRDSEERTAS